MRVFGGAVPNAPGWSYAVRESGDVPSPTQADRTREAAVASGGKRAMSGPKGFAIVIGGMLGIMLVLWTLAALAAP